MDDNKYRFNREILKQNIDNWQKMLLSKNITKEQKASLKQCIYYFKCYLAGEIVATDVKEIKVSEVLDKMKNDFASIDRYLFGYVNSLVDLLEYSSYEQCYCSDVTPEIIVNNSLEIYNEFLPDLYNTAFDFINDERHLINFSDNQNIRSLCIKPTGMQIPFVSVSDYKRRPIIFVHELQHAVEIKRKYNLHPYASETVPVLLETLYIDKILKKGDTQSVYLYYERINSILNDLRKLNAYFLSLQELNQYNFYVSKHKLINILINNKFIKNESGIAKAYNFDVKLALNYVNSFIKSINLRNTFYDDKKKGRSILENFWLADYIGFNSILFSSILVDNYLKEIEQKKKELVLK